MSGTYVDDNALWGTELLSLFIWSIFYSCLCCELSFSCVCCGVCCMIIFVFLFFLCVFVCLFPVFVDVCVYFMRLFTCFCPFYIPPARQLCAFVRVIHDEIWNLGRVVYDLVVEISKTGLIQSHCWVCWMEQVGCLPLFFVLFCYSVWKARFSCWRIFTCFSLVCACQFLQFLYVRGFFF